MTKDNNNVGVSHDDSVDFTSSSFGVSVVRITPCLDIVITPSSVGFVLIVGEMVGLLSLFGTYKIVDVVGGIVGDKDDGDWDGFDEGDIVGADDGKFDGVEVG